MKLKTTPEERAVQENRVRQLAELFGTDGINPNFWMRFFDDFATLENALHEARDDADAQRQLAENYMDAFASKPDQRLADGLEEHVTMLKKELKSARKCIEQYAVLNCKDYTLHPWLARQWLKENP